MKQAGLLAMALLAGCSVPAARAPDDRAPTIVSLNPCTDAILAELAGPEQVLAISHYSHDPRASSMDVAKARQFRTTGGTVEEVLALKPDIAVVSTYTPAPVIAALERAGISVVGFGIAQSVEDSTGQIRDLAAIAGHREQGEKLVARIERALAAASPAESNTVSALLWQPGGIVAGRQSLVAELLERTGFINHAANIGMGQADYVALEQVLAAPPDLLLLAGSEVGQRHPVLDRLSQTRREIFDPSLLYCGGPTIIRAARRLRQIRGHFE